ncbi:MAG: hypothetical protein ACYTFT_06720 [Planctomycetota bacterium]|jgi:hypothetical protein
MKRTLSIAMFPILALALSLSACGGENGESGTPSGLSATSGGGGGGGGGGGTGGGAGQFFAGGYSDELLFGPGTQQFPSEVNVVAELFTGATQFVLMERVKGSGAAYTANPNAAQAANGGSFWNFALPAQDMEYFVDAQDAGGASVGTSDNIIMDLLGGGATFPINSPNTGAWIDVNTGAALQPPVVAAPTTVTWTPPSVGTTPAGYIHWGIEVDPAQTSLVAFTLTTSS